MFNYFTIIILYRYISIKNIFSIFLKLLTGRSNAALRGLMIGFY